MIGLEELKEWDEAIKLADKQIETPQYKAKRMLKALDVKGFKVATPAINAIAKFSDLNLDWVR